MRKNADRRIPLGTWMMAEMKEKGISQADIAEMLYVDVSAISSIICGRKPLKTEMIKPVAEILGDGVYAFVPRMLEFVEFKFPSWEVINESDGLKSDILTIEVTDEGYGFTVSLWYGKNMLGIKTFDNNGEGYEVMCKWLNEKKLELARAFCG